MPRGIARQGSRQGEHEGDLDSRRADHLPTRRRPKDRHRYSAGPERPYRLKPRADSVNININLIILFFKMYLIFVMNVICFVISNAVLLHNNVSYSHAAQPSLGLAIMHTRKCVAFTMYLFSLKTFTDFKSSCETHVLFNFCFYLNMTMLFLTCLLFLSAYRTTVNVSTLILN